MPSRESVPSPVNHAPLALVLVSTDLTPGARLAASRAARLPLARQARLVLVHVLPERVPPRHRATVEAGVRDDLELEAARLRHVLDGRGRQDVGVEPVVCRGRPASVLSRETAALGADLIVIGRHGRRAVRDLLIGSTALKVARAGRAPVLVVHRAVRRPYRVPLVAVDLEMGSTSLLDEASRLVAPDTEDGAVIHAYQVAFEGFLSRGMTSDDLADLRRDARRVARGRIERLLSAADEPVRRWSRLIVRGDARVAVATQAVRRGCDLVVVGTHAWSAWRQAFIGSVAERILETVRCDVLVVPPRPRLEEAAGGFASASSSRVTGQRS